MSKVGHKLPPWVEVVFQSPVIQQLPDVWVTEKLCVHAPADWLSW